MMISDILRQMESSDMGIDLLEEKIEQVRLHARQYYESGHTTIEALNMIKPDVNKVGPILSLTRLRQLIIQTFRKCAEDNNLEEALKNMYKPRPSYHLAQYEQEVQSWENLSRLQTGIQPLDMAMGGGISPGQLLVITGAAGSMKTSLSLKIVDTYLETVKDKVLFFSLDMEAPRILLRRLLPLMNLNVTDALKEVKGYTDLYLEAKAKREEQDEGNFSIVDGPHDLEKIQRIIECEAPSVVIIDFLTCIDGFNSELECARETIRCIREWKRSYGITFVTLNQLSEASKLNQKKGEMNPPAMGGGSSEQAADVKIDLFRDAPLDDSYGSNKPRIIATISKNRNEVPGKSFEIEYSGKTLSFPGQATEVFRRKEPKVIFESYKMPF